MASSQGQQNTPAILPFSIFRGASWANGRKKVKRANLGEENSMFFHPELKRWVERGKEEEAEREAAGPPPPPVISGSLTSTPLSKRSLSQRYVLQPNLSISSSMASMAGSVSQADLVGLAAAPGDGFSGPPSAIGSTAPSPPQSGNCLIPPAFFARSGPPSGTSGHGSFSPPAFFTPSPRGESTTSPAGGLFFVPSQPQSDSASCETVATAAVVAATTTAASPDCVVPPAHDEPAGFRMLGGPEELLPTIDSISATEDSGEQGPALGSVVSQALSSTAELSLRCSLATVFADDANRFYPSNVKSGSELCVLAEDPNAALSFPSTVERQVDSPVPLAAAVKQSHPLVFVQPGLVAREHRRPGGAAANASDGGAAISLHEGMGFAPVRPHGHNMENHVEGVVTNRFELTAVDEGDVGGPESPPSTAYADGQAAGGNVCGGEAEAASPADAVTTSDSAGSSSALHSQYYYQQYAYLYQYAVGQGYSEPDAVAYAQYYATMYAHQYEAQAPQGEIGGVGSAADGESATIGVETVTVDGTAAASAVSVAAADAVGAAAEPAWQVAAAAAEDEASVVALGLSGSKVGPAKVEDAGRDDDPVYVDAPPAMHSARPGAPVIAGPTFPDAAVEAEVDPRLITAAPLPADLTAAASAAVHHHQSAVTAAVAAAAAVFEQQQWASRQVDLSYGVGPAPAASTATDAVSNQLSAAALAPQLLLGLGAAGAKRLTQLSAVASAAVASLGATVASTAPVAAALSAATAAASRTAAAAAGGFVGQEGLSGLSEDDFERIMHPGDPAKLDGPLPWELPEHLRAGRKFMALCANWQMANPGQPYAPHLLLQQSVQLSGHAKALEVASQGAQQALAGNGGDVALAAEGGLGSSGGAGPIVAAAQEVQQSVEAKLSSYERACSLAQFGQPVVELLAKREAKQAPLAAATAAASPEEVVESPQQQLAQQLQLQSPASPDGIEFAAGAVPFSKPALGTSLGTAEVIPAVPKEENPAPNAAPAVALNLCLLPTMDSPTGHGTPGSARSDDPFAGTEHVPLSQQLQLQHSPQDSAIQLPCGGATLEQVLEQERRIDALAAVEDSAECCSLQRLGTVEAASFFDHLGEQAQTPAAAQQEATAHMAADAAAQARTEETVKQMAAAASANAFEEAGVPDEAVTAPATAAAAAIDSVVQALEQLRSGAAAGNGGAMEDPASGIALLLQIQSSLAQATEALAGMGVDVSALSSLAAMPMLQSPVLPVEWTPSASHKRPRVDASYSTPTRAAAAGTGAEGVATPVLAPGPPVGRQVDEETGMAGAAERYQQLGKRLSEASDEAACPVFAQGNGAEAHQPSLLQQQPSVVVSLTVTPAPEVDEAAVEARVRCEEGAVWEARLGAVMDSEREAAALVIAAVERERDGLQQRTRNLDAALLAVTTERDALIERLEGVEVECQQARASMAEAEAQREALAARLSEVTVERDTLAEALTAERSEKTVLAEALSSARTETEELRRRYEARFSALSSELEATRSSLAALQGEHDELLLCLGQESTKVAVLTDALRGAGGDPEPLIEKIEAEYEAMELGGPEAADGGPEGMGDQVAASEQADDEEGWEGEDLQL